MQQRDGFPIIVDHSVRLVFHPTLDKMEVLFLYESKFLNSNQRAKCPLRSLSFCLITLCIVTLVSPSLVTIGYLEQTLPDFKCGCHWTLRHVLLNFIGVMAFISSAIEATLGSKQTCTVRSVCIVKTSPRVNCRAVVLLPLTCWHWAISTLILAGETPNIIIMGSVWSQSLHWTACRRTHSTWPWGSSPSTRSRGRSSLPLGAGCAWC